MTIPLQERIPLKCECGNRDDTSLSRPPCSADCGRTMDLDTDALRTALSAAGARPAPGERETWIRALREAGDGKLTLGLTPKECADLAAVLSALSGGRGEREPSDAAIEAAKAVRVPWGTASMTGHHDFLPEMLRAAYAVDFGSALPGAAASGREDEAESSKTGSPMNQREQDYLDVAIEAKAGRRPVDADLRGVADWRETLFCAASNLECDPPQSQPAIAAELRKLADVVVTLSLAASDLTVKNVVDRLRARSAPRPGGEGDATVKECRCPYICGVHMGRAASGDTGASHGSV